MYKFLIIAYLFTLEKLKHSFEMKHLELMGQLQVQRASFKTELEKQKSEKLAHARDPKPYFEESKDKMDSYLSRFEKYATANKWDKNDLGRSSVIVGRKGRKHLYNLVAVFVAM